MEHLRPDLILDSRTRLVNKNMLSFNPPAGMLNLHPGLSPLIEGGSNCTGWRPAIKQFHLTGNKVMLIDKGFDLRNITNSEFTMLTGEESHAQMQLRVMTHADDLDLCAVKFLSERKPECIPQKKLQKEKHLTQTPVHRNRN